MPVSDVRPASEHLETMRFGRFHRSFLLMVTAGEFVETLMLLGNGVVLALVAKVLHFSPVVSTWAVPVSFFGGEFFGSILSGLVADRLGRKAVFRYDLLATAILAGVFGTAFAEVASTTATVVFGFIVAFVLWQFSNFLHTYQAEIFPTRVRSTAAGTVYSVSRLSTSLFVYIITTWLLPHGLLAVYSLIWVFILIVVVDVAAFGPQASGRTVETIAH